ncbi:MAG: hypothetical protein DRN04_14885 [Thermoprotei archaeon]|nr:MAG: hypothetical protein DRN04_14885 [Thermoprotei archaeon]
MRKKRYGRTFLTEEEVKVLDVLLKYRKVTDAAKELGKAQPTVSTVKRRIEEKLSMAIETVKLALRKGLIDREELLRLIDTAVTYEELKEEKVRKRGQEGSDS